MGLSDGLDNQILAGTNGLFTGTNLANHAASAITTFADYISEFAYSRVDGRYASTTGDIKVVMGSSTYTHAGGVYRNASVDRTALDRLMEVSGGVRVSAHVPGVASHKQNSVIRRGMNRDMVAPIWEGVTIIPGRCDQGQARPDSDNGCNATRRQAAALGWLLQTGNATRLSGRSLWTTPLGTATLRYGKWEVSAFWWEPSRITDRQR